MTKSRKYKEKKNGRPCVAGCVFPHGKYCSSLVEYGFVYALTPELFPKTKNYLLQNFYFECFVLIPGPKATIDIGASL